MNNPWDALPETAPFVLPVDAVAVEQFNGRVRNRDHELHLEVVPEPFLGDPQAPVVLLNLNPGFNEDDTPVHLDIRFNSAAHSNLLHAHEQSPFYLLDRSLPSPGQTWWIRKLRRLIDAAGYDVVARNVFVAEIHGYHSRRYGHPRIALPSQNYTLHLVRRALHRNAAVVIMRSGRLWYSLIPELRAYGRRYHLRSVQNPVVSPQNCPDGFEDIVTALRIHGDGNSKLFSS